LADLDLAEDRELGLETAEDAWEERRGDDLDAVEIKLGEVSGLETLENLVVGAVETLNGGLCGCTKRTKRSLQSSKCARRASKRARWGLWGGRYSKRDMGVAERRGINGEGRGRTPGGWVRL